MCCLHYRQQPKETSLKYKLTMQNRHSTETCCLWPPLAHSLSETGKEQAWRDYGGEAGIRPFDDYVRFLTGLAWHLCKGNSQASTIRHDNPAFITGGVLLLIKIKISLTHNSHTGREFPRNLQVSAAGDSAHQVSDEPSSEPHHCLQRPQTARGSLNTKAALYQQRASSALSLLKRAEGLDSSCTDTHSFGSSLVKSPLAKLLTRDTKPSSFAHGLGEVTDHFMDPGPVT